MVQPLHLQDNLSKIPLMQKVHEAARAVPEAEREQFARQLNQEAHNKAQRTQDTKETEKNVIRNKQKRKDRKKKKRSKKGLMTDENQAETNENETNREMSGSLIDITV